MAGWHEGWGDKGNSNLNASRYASIQIHSENGDTTFCMFLRDDRFDAGKFTQMTDDTPRFRTATAKALLDLSLAEANGGEKVRISATLAELVSEYLRCVVVEATERAKMVAGTSLVIDESHLEKILPQLLLDIS
jgi:centromere protein X